MAAGRKAEIKDEFGDLLFAVVNLGRHLDVDAEDALRGTNDKFRNRFHAVEAALTERDDTLEAATLDEMEAPLAGREETGLILLLAPLPRRVFGLMHDAFLDLADAFSADGRNHSWLAAARRSRMRWQAVSGARTRTSMPPSSRSVRSSIFRMTVDPFELAMLVGTERQVHRLQLARDAQLDFGQQAVDALARHGRHGDGLGRATGLDDCGRAGPGRAGRSCSRPPEPARRRAPRRDRPGSPPRLSGPGGPFVADQRLSRIIRMTREFGLDHRLLRQWRGKPQNEGASAGSEMKPTVIREHDLTCRAATHASAKGRIQSVGTRAMSFANDVAHSSALLNGEYDLRQLV